MDTGTEERIVISELMSANKSVLADRAGNFGDWIELHNPGTETLQLEGYVLNCGDDKWVFPACSMAPGSYRVVFCDREDRADGDEKQPAAGRLCVQILPGAHRMHRAVPRKAALLAGRELVPKGKKPRERVRQAFLHPPTGVQFRFAPIHLRTSLCDESHL